MNQSFLYGLNEIVVQCVFLALMLAATEAGFYLGSRLRAGIPAATRAQISTVEAALLGILALLLGFTMTMAVSRFDVRTKLLVDEANGIGTACLRVQLLPAPEGPRIAALLREYINLRVEYGTAGNDLTRLAALRTQTVKLQTELWTLAVAYAQKDPNPVKAGLMLESLNQAFDLEAARWTAFQNSVPDSVMLVNAALALLATMLVGYSFGMDGRRDLFSMCLLALSITMVLAVITDLNRPRAGFIRSSQQPMLDLLHRP